MNRRLSRKKLKTGFSTGSAAAAAAKAALTAILNGPVAQEVTISLPDGGRLDIGVKEVEILSPGRARARVIKDAGDDPDVTHKAAIDATVWDVRPAAAYKIDVSGGPGVGRVTRPGLPVRVGKAAINPVPLAMIETAIKEAWQEHGSGRALAAKVEIAVPRGQELAQKTLNPRLGIVGGISILGTTGLVKPFSHEAYTATIDSALKVAKASGLDEVVLTTGGRSEKLAMRLRLNLPEAAFVQMADYFGFALKRANEVGVAKVGLVSFFGKAIKQAQGLEHTHAHKAALELARLSRWLDQAGADKKLCAQVAGANTARHALQILRRAGRLELVKVVGQRCLRSMRSLSGGRQGLWAVVVDYNGSVLFEGKTPEEAK